MLTQHMYTQDGGSATLRERLIALRERIDSDAARATSASRGGEGFTLLELVVAVSIMLIIATTGVIGYQAIQSNARDAAVESAAQTLYTGAQAERHAPGRTDYAKVKEEYDATSDGITTKIDEGTVDVCVQTIYDSHPSHTAKRGDCSIVDPITAPGEDGSDNTGDSGDNSTPGDDDIIWDDPEQYDDPIMVSTWNVEAGQTVELPMGQLNGTVDWGASGEEVNKTTFTYDEAGTVQITVEGYFSSWGHDGQDLTGMVSVDQWGDTGTTSLAQAFYNSDIQHVEELPAGVEIMALAFEGTDFNGDVSGWDTSSVHDMSAMFAEATQFNQDVSGWDVSSVETMNGMFDNATAFNNGGRALDWEDTGSLQDAGSIFSGATSFNQDVSSWDMANVVNLHATFSGASSFNQDLSDWDTANVEDMSYMFRDATSFDQDVNGLDTSKVSNMSDMFYGAFAFNNGGEPLTWNVSGKNTGNMLTNAFAFTNGGAGYQDWMIEAGVDID